MTMTSGTQVIAAIAQDIPVIGTFQDATSPYHVRTSLFLLSLITFFWVYLLLILPPIRLQYSSSDGVRMRAVPEQSQP